MIATIGSLVQEISTRRRWLFAVTLYVLACSTTAMLLGGSLGAVGALGHHLACHIDHCLVAGSSESVGVVIVGVLAVAYAGSDLGLVRLPRPYIMPAVPVTWWRRWRPYGAAVAYGAALGMGITTRIPFGTFYVLCAWCLLSGSAGYGAALLGTYGAARALVLVPVSWRVYRRQERREAHLEQLFSAFWSAQRIVAVLLAAFGAELLLSALH